MSGYAAMKRQRQLDAHIETELVHIASPEEEERLRQWLYRRHRKLVGARKARSPVVPDHLLPLSSIKKDDIP